MGVVASFDALCLVFFVMHLPITLFIDAQLIVDAQLFPYWAQKLLGDYIQETGDPTLIQLELWFMCFVVCELLIQAPFFVIAIVCYLLRSPVIRIPAIVYSAHTCTTLVPILGSLLIPYMQGEEIDYDLGRLLLTYVPFFVIPFLLGVRWVFCDSAPFSSGQQQRDAKKDV